MSENRKVKFVDYSKTLFLPQTEFPMRAGLPQREPKILNYWKEDQPLRESARRPAATQNSCCMTARRTPTATSISAMPEQDPEGRRPRPADARLRSNVPGWDCHGLPIEWKIEEENYRSKGKRKPDFHDSTAMVAFRKSAAPMRRTGSTCGARN
jgi:isoleucyl-tRNA synthetase